MYTTIWDKLYIYYLDYLDNKIKKYFTNYKINKIWITHKFHKDYKNNLKELYTNNIVRKYQINKKLKKMYYMLYKLLIY